MNAPGPFAEGAAVAGAAFVAHIVVSMDSADAEVFALSLHDALPIFDDLKLGAVAAEADGGDVEEPGAGDGDGLAAAGRVAGVGVDAGDGGHHVEVGGVHV